MSRWSSPIPEIVVCPVSGFVLILKVGSSSASFWRAIAIFSWSAFVFGSTACVKTGSGKSIPFIITGFFSSHKVSAVVVFLSPTAAPISPEYISGISSLWFACIRSILPILSLTFFVEFKTYDPLFSVPEYTLKNVSLPTNGSVAILNAKAVNGSASEGCLNTVLPLGSVHSIASISVGAGK